MDILALLSGVVIPLIGILTQKEWKKFKNNQKVSKFRNSINVDQQINEILNEIRIKHGFNRVSIIDYHNGTQSLNGFSFKYATMTYESTDNHTKDIITEYKGIPCSIMSNKLNQLENTPKGYAFESIRGFDEQSLLIYKMFGVDTSHSFRLGNSLINGCVNCTFTALGNNNNNLLTGEQILDIKAYCQKILLLKNKH